MIHIIEYINVSKSYGTKTVIKNLNLKIEKGQFATLIGSSGCGKTTTLKMLNGLIPYDSGEILINGENINKYEPNILRRKIGYVIQSIGLFPNMTVEENIKVVPELLKWDKEKTLSRVKELMALVEMPYEKYSKKYPRQLSGGQQQRVGVMRALAADPDIILMDEPFGALDPITRDIMQIEVRKLQKKLKKTILFVTHDMNEAIKMSDVIIFMDEGKIIQKASPSEMLENPANNTIKEFLSIHLNKKNLNKNLLCKDVMRKPAITSNIKSTPREAVWLMKEKSIDTLIIVDDANQYKGVININVLYANKDKLNTIGELLSYDHKTIDAYESAKTGFELLESVDFNFLIVLENEEPVGILTKSSMADGMAAYLWKGEEVK